MSKSKIYTRTGDRGQTSLVCGTRASKGNLQVDAYGDVDELNSFLGLAIAQISGFEALHVQSQALSRVQHTLFTVGSHLAISKEKKDEIKLPQINDEVIEQLENQIDEMDSHLAPMKEFILPGGGLEASHLHICRTIARRCERKLIMLINEVSDLEIDSNILKLVNRLSDYLFVLARFVNFTKGIEDAKWDKDA